MILTRVDLPAPFWPTSPWTSSPAQREVDAVEHLDPAERLADATRGQDDRSRVAIGRRGASTVIALRLSGASRRLRATATMMITPRAIICSVTERPMRMSPLLSTPMTSDPTRAPTIEPRPPGHARAADHGGRDHRQQVRLAERVAGAVQSPDVEQAGQRGRE